MDFNDTPEQAAFRKEIRDFIEKELPERFKDAGGFGYGGGGGGDMRSRFEEMKEWRKKLSDKGWIAAAWPKEYGGAGLGTMEQFIMNEEFAQNRTPPVGAPQGMADPYPVAGRSGVGGGVLHGETGAGPVPALRTARAGQVHAAPGRTGGRPSRD